MVKIALLGYGNLARGIIDNLPNFPDMQLQAIFSRRPDAVTAAFPVYAATDLQRFKGKVDVVILCGGSATDLPAQSPKAAECFNIVDSFDTHAKIPEHFAAVNSAAKAAGTLGLISAGWDPGLFSVMRGLFNSFMPAGEDYTFWGKGVSQGHSDAIRRVPGVMRGVQYTVPKQPALLAVREGKNPKLTARDKHLRECFVVASDGANKTAIESEIKSMPNYFADYDTVVHFITEKEFEQEHKGMPHGGFVLRSGTGKKVDQHLLELKISLSSNPHFTSAVLLSYARAVFRLRNEGKTGCITPMDVPPTALYAGTSDELRKNFL